jgi:hypothetical protein
VAVEQLQYGENACSRKRQPHTPRINKYDCLQPKQTREHTTTPFLRPTLQGNELLEIPKLITLVTLKPFNCGTLMFPYISKIEVA